MPMAAAVRGLPLRARGAWGLRIAPAGAPRGIKTALALIRSNNGKLAGWQEPPSQTSGLAGA